MTNPKKDATEILLELLDLVPDVDKLEIMLEPESLLTILLARGRTEAQIRAELETKLPGELLLDVLREEKDPDALFALLGRPAPKASPTKPSPVARLVGAGAAALSRAQAKAAAGPDPFVEGSMTNKIGGVALLAGVVAPAMIVAGFFPEWNVLSLAGWIAVATAIAAFSGALYVHGRAPWYVGSIGGASSAPGALLAIYLWTRDREFVLKLEIGVAFLVGALPGLIVYSAWFKKAAFRAP